MNAAAIYEGSNGDATKALYTKLETLGPTGVIAMNLFRAQKCSTRAKAYSRRYKADAYDRKNWSMGLLCKALTESASALGIEWGWKQDPHQEFHNWVLYVEIPTGQVSFHAANRMCAKDYAGEWDGSGLSAERIVRWTQQILDGQPCEVGAGNATTAMRDHVASDEARDAAVAHRPREATPAGLAVHTTTEFIYTWPDGREEVRYRRAINSREALKLIDEVNELQNRFGENCPYSYRNV